MVWQWPHKYVDRLVNVIYIYIVEQEIRLTSCFEEVVKENKSWGIFIIDMSFHSVIGNVKIIAIL